ncbi:MAG: histidinol dehydrogenase, partial [Bacteroidota bacterium]
TSTDLAKAVSAEVDRQVELLPRKEMAIKSLENSYILVIGSMEDMLQLVNDYAPEHLIINMEDADEVADQIINAGSIFIGALTPESAGDYASGTNHTLPTNGWASTMAGVSLDSFVKKITYQKLTPQGLLNLGQTIEIMAEAEQLHAHKNAVSLRLASLQK